MSKNKIIKNISKALIIGAFLIPFNLIAQTPGDPGGSTPGTDANGTPCSDPDALCPVDTGTIAIVIAGLAIGTIMLMRKKNTAFYQVK